MGGGPSRRGWGRLTDEDGGGGAADASRPYRLSRLLYPSPRACQQNGQCQLWRGISPSVCGRRSFTLFSVVHGFSSVLCLSGSGAPSLSRSCRLRVPRPLPCVLLNLFLEATVPVCSIAGEVRPGRGQSRYRGAHPPRHHSAPHPRQPAASARRWLNEGPPLTSCGWVHKGIGRGYSSRLLSARFNVGAPLRAAVRRTKMFCVADAIISPLRGRRNASPHSSSPIRLPPFFL